ncbi:MULTISPECIES: DUF4376 domain-containing protein [unclassified Sedimentibacter]|uniref:DUF4376 domain-containing protein n=1 Tax=unclassified Sedimentibacter TaxID=2649220 RepID=UPI0027DFC6D8|nr:hypothetical protein [Sedimentibacter sp. MB35-C1]WMJ78511.1 hypothetical protein RBQ61_06200 [Sedimentibacter sp. MB35-C1]
MIIYKKTKGFEQRSDKPNENWADEDCFVVEDNSELAGKIIQAYPYYEFITDSKGNLIDVEVLDNPNILTNSKEVKIAQSKQQLAEFLQQNPLQFTDGKLYSVTEEKQTLLANAIQVYQMKVQAGLLATLKWNATGEECTEWTLEELSTLALAIAEYVEPLVAHQQSLEVQIRNATTLEELEGIEINYEMV